MAAHRNWRLRRYWTAGQREFHTTTSNSTPVDALRIGRKTLLTLSFGGEDGAAMVMVRPNHTSAWHSFKALGLEMGHVSNPSQRIVFSTVVHFRRARYLEPDVVSRPPSK